MARLVFTDKGRSEKAKYFHARKSHGWRKVHLYLDTTTRKWWEDPDVVVAFNLPRISAALERLMGTNIVRLTDRNYMKELRARIENDYRENLQKRIQARELKEVERERVLIIEGKTDVIPPELADDPIFVVDKKAQVEIAKTRSKLKTNREKNAERLKSQGVKWERERMKHEEQESERINALRKRFKEQKDLLEQYKEEDPERAMDLLRIENEDWRPCEQELKEFLEKERAKMKERSWRIPTPFTSDPKDINSIMRAKKSQGNVQKRPLKAIKGKPEQKPQNKVTITKLSDYVPPVKQDDAAQSEMQVTEGESLKEIVEYNRDFAISQGDMSSDNESDLSMAGSVNAGSSLSLTKERYAEILREELENDVAEGFIISKEQYDHLRYEDEKIMQLRHARDMQELYRLAEQIIIGDRIEFSDDEDAEGGEGAK